MDYNRSDIAKDKAKRITITITLNEKLATLNALDESILAAIDEGNSEGEIEESEVLVAKRGKFSWRNRIAPSYQSYT